MSTGLMMQCRFDLAADKDAPDDVGQASEPLITFCALERTFGGTIITPGALRDGTQSIPEHLPSSCATS